MPQLVRLIPILVLLWASSTPAWAHNQTGSYFGPGDPDLVLVNLEANYPAGDSMIATGTFLTISSSHAANATYGYVGTPTVSGAFNLFTYPGGTLAIAATEEFTLDPDHAMTARTLSGTYTVSSGSNAIRANSHIANPEFYPVDDSHTITGFSMM